MISGSENDLYDALEMPSHQLRGVKKHDTSLKVADEGTFVKGDTVTAIK